MRNLNNFPVDNIGDIRYNEPLSLHSTWKIGGPADIFIEPHSIEQIQRIVEAVKIQKKPLVVIGNGSNILFSDNGIRGIVLKIGENFSKISINNNHIIAESGVYIPKLAASAADAGLSGLEHTIGIPGSLGGLIYMNGGSMKRAIGDIVDFVEVIDRNGKQICYSQPACKFSFRHSLFQETNMIICKIGLTCTRQKVTEIFGQMNEIRFNRERKFPLNLPSCGSVFLSTPDLNTTINTPGKLIEDAGFKGFQIGHAQVSPHHANFIVNLGDAKATDIIELIHHIREKIYDLHSVWLSCEIKYIDEQGTIRPLHEV